MKRPRLRFGHVPLVVSTCAAVAAAFVLGGEQRAAGQAAPSANAVQATGTGTGTLITSAVVNGEPQAWGWTTVDKRVPAPVIDGAALSFAPGEGVQMVLTRWTARTQWQLARTPVGPDGHTRVSGVNPYDTGVAGTPQGGLALLGSDLTPNASRKAIEVQPPNGQLQELPDPPDGVLDTAAGESFSEGDPGVVTAFAAVDEGSSTGVFAGALGVAREHAVTHWDGNAWSREPVCVRDESGTVPDGCAGGETMPDAQPSLKFVALSAADTGHAWLLATPDAQTGRAFVLFRRVGTGSSARWAYYDAAGVPLAAASDPALGTSGVAPLGYNSGKLTATTDGVWVDVGLTTNDGQARQATMFLDQRQGGGVTSWCDGSSAGGGALCDHPLGFRLPSVDAGTRGVGYRSFAWAGAGFGTRVISNPVDVGIGSDLKNRGTYATLEGDRFVRKAAHSSESAGTNAAFASPVEGWIQGPVHVTTGSRAPDRLAHWALPVRRPLTAIVPEAGRSPGDLGTPALAVGDEGTVVRYRPGAGWEAEFLLGSSGARARPRLRGVAWPTPGVAYAVGDRGAQWRWRASTGLWEQDPGAPPDERYDLNAIAFDPSNPGRGYAVGRNGTILALNKSWNVEAVPADTPRTGALAGPADLTSVAFAGHEALVAAGGAVLANSGDGWHVDQGVAQLLARLGPTTSTTGPHIYAVAGLPDGGAVAAGGTPGGGSGGSVVLIRDGAGAAWRFADQPLDQTVSAVAAVRDGSRVRPVVSISSLWPPADEYNLNPPSPGSPPTLIPPLSIPTNGYLLRETAGGWRDEQESAPAGQSIDAPPKPDPALALALDSNGEGWVAGGWTGEDPRGLDAAPPKELADLVPTASISRYSQGTPAGGPGAAAAAVPMDPGAVTFAVGGNARCEEACAAERDFAIGPDVNLRAGLALAAQLARLRGGPRAMLYTGGRLHAPQNTAANQPAFSDFEANRFAELMGSQGGGLGVYPALSPGEAGQGNANAFIDAFGGFAAPFGSGAAPSGITPVAAAPTGGGARTHYAFDSRGVAGTVRVIVIDNSAGSLADSDPYQNPREGQADWLARVLDDARAQRIPAIVVGNKDLNERLSPPANVASDAHAVATLLRDKGASAYFFDRPEENRAYTIPAGTTNTIPAFASGTLGYLGGEVDSNNQIGSTGSGDIRYGLASLMLAQIDVRLRNPATNRAPVTVRAVPLLEDLSIEAVDGTFLRRSQPALFTGLGRRPRAGDRYGGDSSSPHLGSGSYTPLPTDPCSAQEACLGRVDPEFRFTSSDPDIADFVRQDPNSDNRRKPYLDPRTDKPVASDTSGLLCAYNAGRTTVTIASGGRSFSLPVTIQQGSVQRPCGTTPLNPSRFLAQQPQRSGQPAAPPPPPPPAPAPSPSPAPPPPPQPPAAAVPPVLAPPAPVAPAARPTPTPRVPIPSAPVFAPAVVIPPFPVTARPIPPSGTSPVSASTPVTQPVSQAERQREDEEATEQSSAYAAYRPPDHPSVAPWLAGFAVLAAFALAGTGFSRRREPRRPRLARAGDRTPFNPPNGGPYR